jgi:hypothetical protein
MALQSFVGPWPLFQFLNLYTVGRTSWTGDQPVARPLPTHRTTQTQNKSTQTFMPRVEFEPTIPLFERTKSVHAWDRAATVMGFQTYRVTKNSTNPPLLYTRSTQNYLELISHHTSPWDIRSTDENNNVIYHDGTTKINPTTLNFIQFT